MGHIPLLEELAVIAALGVVVSVILARLRLPTTTGLLAAGALVGPSGLRVVRSTEQIQALAEIGVVLLLFTIGLEFSLARLRHIAKQVAIGGSLQVGLTIAATLVIALAAGARMELAIVYGFVAALSSTAIVLRALSDRAEIDAPHGRFIVGVLIFQDLCVVAMVLIVPLLGGATENAATQIGFALLKAAGVVIGLLLLARTVVPRILAWVDRSRSREVFLLAVLGICLGTAWLTSLAELSLALGAFLGGMLVADTDYKHRALGDVLPLRDAFTSIFFVSLGMLFDVRALLGNPVMTLALFAALTLGKGVVATFAALAMRFPARAAWLSGVGLAQFGEFGFVLATIAAQAGVVARGELNELLTAGVMSMFVTPVLMMLAPHVTAGERLLRPLERMLGARGIDEAATEHAALSGHVVLVGYGVGGKLVGRALSERKIPYVILELNAETVRKAREAGEPVYYADASSSEALEHAGVSRAGAVVLLINDPVAARRAIQTVRSITKDVPIFTRTRYLADRDELVTLGSTDVVSEEVEAGVEMLAKVLSNFDVPRNELDEHVDAARHATVGTSRSLTVPRKMLSEMGDLADLKIERARIRSGDHALGRTIRSLELRARTSALVVAVRRGEELLQDPGAERTFEEGDIVYLVGSRDAIAAAIALLARGAASG